MSSPRIEVLQFSVFGNTRDHLVRAAEASEPCAYEDWKSFRGAVEEAAGKHAKLGDFRGGAVVVGHDWFRHPIVSVVVEGGHLLNPDALQSLSEVLRSHPMGSLIEITGDLGSPADGIEAVVERDRCVVGWRECGAEDCLRRITKLGGNLASTSVEQSKEHRW